MPRFDQSFSGLCEQNLQDTLHLKQRFLDTKAKRPPKSKQEKKQQESIQSSVHVQQKFLKRPAEEHDPGGGQSESFEPPVKLQCTGTHQNEGLTKFSVEIVQQLEFTTSAASSQPQQISTNVTVKTHANASVKSDVSSPKSNPSTPTATASTMHQKSNIGLDVGTLVECVKQEPDNDFADLDQCAAALEKDAAANGGAGFGGFPDLIGDDTNDEIISSATFNDLISDISNYPDYELMKDFDFEDKSEINTNNSNLKVEDIKDFGSTPSVESAKNTHSPLVVQNQNNYSPQPVFEVQNKARMAPYANIEFPKTELSPAAQTLKQMAEQHHKNQMGLSFNPQARVPNSRSPYPDFQFQGDFHGSPNSNPNFHKGSPNFPPTPDMIKQEMIFQGSNDFDMKRKAASAGMYKQQYSPYSSPSASSHGSPGYLPGRGNTGPPNNGSGGPYGGGTPPRPPSGPGQNNSGASVQINQAQQLNISQQSHGHTIQVSAGQHVHLSGDLKGNVSIAAQQGMHFSQHSSGQNGSNPQQQQQQSGATNAQQAQQQTQQSPMSASQHQNSSVPPNNINSPGGAMNSPASQMGSTLLGSASQQMPGALGPQLMGSPLSGAGGLPSSSNTLPGSMPGPNNMGMPSSANSCGANSGIGVSSSMGGNMGGMPHPSMQHVGGMADSYSMSQTQTINFTQQSLRRANVPGVPNPMGPTMGMSAGGPMGAGGRGQSPPNMGPRLINAQTLEQQKLLQQQHILRAHQQAAMQQQMVRPPPPDYKTSAGMMQGIQPRYAQGPPTLRRMPLQSMPPSGPIIRSNMYMLQQQQQQQQQQQHQSQMAQRPGLYVRQQAPQMANVESMQHNNAEWRHLLMSQQQSSSFGTGMRPNFQQGFNINSSNMQQQMSALQHQQQLRSQQQQQSMVSGTMGGLGAGQQQSMAQGMSQAQLLAAQQSNSPMAQMNNMNQTMLHIQQQQQQSLMQQQQQNSHMSMSNIHMQQSQSISVSGQSISQQQQGNVGGPLGNSAPSSNNQNNVLSNFNPQADFNFEFLDNLTSGDTAAFTDQELLNSFDSDPGFNLDF